MCTSIHRSQKMSMYQLVIPFDATFDITSDLGEVGVVQFRDLNESVNSYQRAFLDEIERCSDIEKRLEFIRNEIKKEGLKIKTLSWNQEPRAPKPIEIFDLEMSVKADDEVSLALFWKVDKELRAMIQNSAATRETYLKYMEFKEVMRTVEYFFDEGENMELNLELKNVLREEQQAKNIGLVCGTILRDKVSVFEKVLWRIALGNIFLYHEDLLVKLEDPDTGQLVFKSVFIVVFQGEYIKSKIIHIMEGFKCNAYICPERAAERWSVYDDICDRIEDLNDILYEARIQKVNVLEQAAKNIDRWCVMVQKTKATYHAMNNFEWFNEMKRTLVAEFWIPDMHLEILKKSINQNSVNVQSVKPVLVKLNTDEKPPTYHKLNKFTRVFQDLVDAYGANSYEEVNPAPFLVITFPFLFSIMFGDLGHGIIMFCVGLWMVRNEKRFMNKDIDFEVFRIFFHGRYIILLMGLFAIHSGIIYNELFSKSIHISLLGGTTWTAIELGNSLGEVGKRSIMMDPEKTFVKPYIFGLDPIWCLAHNAIVFKNSFRMKLSIVLGVAQMTFGLILSIENYMFFKKYRQIFTVFIPQILFLSSLFVYMVILIFMKWLMYGPNKGILRSAPCAPGILNTIISMMLFTKPQMFPKCEEYMFQSQHNLQLFLLAIALICVPWLFLAEPIVVVCSGEHIHEKRKQAELAAIAKGKPKKKVFFHAHDEEQSTVDVFIYQGIHAIEFVLGAVSNTASYLRLWALALAHEQLSEVLWMQLFTPALASKNSFIKPILLFLVFVGFAFLTISVLVLMEGLSAFLHTLRLHWIEFQSKFYDGNGFPFQPFSFHRILHGH